MHQFLAFFLLLNLTSFSYVCASAVDQASTLATTGQFVDAASLSCRSDLDTLLPDELKLVGVDFQVDGACDDAELKYLTGLKVGQMVKRTDVSNALFYLQHMQRFSLIQLEIISDRLGYRLIFHLTKSPILHRVVVTGFLRGKESLKNVYLIDIGEQFEQQKHHHSIEQIVNFLRDKGYFQARVEDTVTIHSVTKEVVVRCRVKKGPKFQVRNVQVVFDHVGTVAGEEVATLQQGIERLCDSKIKGKFYSFELVETLRQKIKKLLERHGCIDFEIQVLQDLVVDHKNVDLAVHINLERKREFVFWGATFFTSEQLIDHLLLYGKSTWHFPSSLIVDEIEQLYKNKGFWDVHVSVREEKERVFCFIQEGVRTKISSVRFVNNHHVFDVALLKSAFYYLLKSKTFDQDLFKKSCDNVLKMYKQLGFWDVKIVKYDFVPGKKEHTQDLVIVLDEGSKKTLGNISIPGQTEMERQLLMLWGKQVGKGFDFSLLQEQKQWMLRYLKNKGYQKVLINYALHDDQGIVSVVWNVTLAESAVKMGKAIIVGNCKIAHNMLMKEVVHEYGDDWDKQKIETTLQNLRGLSIFDSVQVFPCSDLDENLCKPVYIKLLESDRYEVKTRFGMQQIGKNLQFRRGFTYLFGGTLCIKNPFYRADQFLLEADVTRFYRNVGASYDFAWLADYKIRCQLKLYDALYQQPVYIGSQNFLYKGTQQGFLWNMTHTHLTKKHSQCTLSGSAGVEFVGIFEADQPRLNTIIDYDKALLGKKTAYVFLEPTFLWQRVDTLLNPHRGHIFFMSCKGMFDLDSKTSFFKCLVEHTQYFPIAERATLALRGRAGHIFNRCFQQINPMERFYLGGSNSVRGYERDYCPPFGKLTCPIYDQHAGLPPAACNYWRYAPQGGRTMFNINAELRYNLYKNLGLVFFNDMGALFKHSIYDELKTGPDNFFGGSGFGIRYDTPIGPLRFDVGFKWKIGHPDFQSRHVLYLTIGQAF